MLLRGLLEPAIAWKYLEGLRNDSSKQIITLLIWPPDDEDEYHEYLALYNQLVSQGKMAVVNVDACRTLKDVYFFPLPAETELPSKKEKRAFSQLLLLSNTQPICTPSLFNFSVVCDSGQGPGLLPSVSKLKRSPEHLVKCNEMIV